MAECPLCGDQLFVCCCRFDEDPPEEGDDTDADPEHWGRGSMIIPALN